MFNVPDYNQIRNTVSGYVDKGVDYITGAGSPGKPDLAQFMMKVGAEDLARPNLFLVRFTDFSATIKADGIVSFGIRDALEQPSNLKKLTDFGINKVREYGGNVLMNSEVGKKLMGAYNPKLLKTILPGEWLDGILPSGFDINKDLAMLVKAINMPGTTLDTTKMYFDKRPVSVAKGRNVENIRLTMYLRPGMIERAAMLSWMNMVHDPHRNEFGLYEEYTQDIEIYSLDRRGVPMGVTKCVGCFPTSVSSVSFDYDSNNTIATFDVEFTVSTIQVKKFDGQNPFLDEAISILDNVKTNPFTNKITDTVKGWF
ncbi:MAG: hypothetical protein ACRC9Y_15820 [Aeromonas veronii]